MRHHRHWPNAGAAERGEVGSRWATFRRPHVPFLEWAMAFSTDNGCAGHGWQEVRSLSSMEKIPPASTLMLRTRQARPEVSLRDAS